MDEATAPAVARSWESLTQQVDQLNRTDPRTALALAERWLAEEPAGEGAARARRSWAYALRVNGNYERAEAAFAEAERAFVDLGLNDEAARCQIGRVSALRFLGRYDTAVSLAQTNLAYLESRGSDMQIEAAKQMVNLGSVYWRLGNLHRALDYYRRARRAGRRLADGEVDAVASFNVGLVLADLGRYGEALRAGEYAVRRCRALGLRERLATVEMNLGLLHVRRGEYARALARLGSSRAICEDLGLDQKLAAVNLDLARTYLALNLDAEAADACARAVATLRGLELPFELGHALVRSSQAAERRGEPALARSYVEEAGEIFGRVGNPLWQAVTEVQAIRLQGQLLDTRPSEELVGSCRTAAVRLEELGALDHAAVAWLVVGELEARIDHQGSATAAYETAAELGRRLGAEDILHLAYTARGVLAEPGAPEAALAWFSRAVEHLERLRERARADDLKMALRHGTNLYERIAGLYLRDDVISDAGESRARCAFRWIERGKSRGLLEELLAPSDRGSHARRPQLARAQDRVKDIRARLNEAYNRRYALDRPTELRGGSSDSEDVQLLERQLAQATRDLQILRRGDSASDVTFLLELDRIQAALPAETCLLEYMAVGQEVLCFVIRRDSFRVQRGLGTLRQIEEAAQWFWFHIRKGTYGVEFLRANQRQLALVLDRALQRLGDLLLAPLAELGSIGHLVVVPHGLLYSLPFHAFVYREAALLRRVTVSYAPSAAVFAASVQHGERRPTHPLIVAPSLPDLPWVEEEARRVAKLYPDATLLTGKDATLRAMRRHAPRADALHLATHGVFRTDNPDFSALELADGWLSVGELAELSSDRALITLSACHTGMSGIGPGDELLGLTRAVLGAGSTALLASLWAANDDTTPVLMATFYDGLQRGLSRADSLREAALAVRASDPHPYFWAPFILVGAP